MGFCGRGVRRRGLVRHRDVGTAVFAWFCRPVALLREVSQGEKLGDIEAAIEAYIGVLVRQRYEVPLCVDGVQTCQQRRFGKTRCD